MGGVNYVNPHNPQPTILDYNALSNKNIEMQLNSTSLSKLNPKKSIKKIVQTPSRRMNSSLRAGSLANAPT